MEAALEPGRETGQETMENLRSMLGAYDRMIDALSLEERQRLADIWVGDYVLQER